MLTILAPIIVFGIVVFVHELGHFLAAKSVGVYAPRFSIGFGPALFRRRRGETEYVIAALPLGGYVRMASREDEATAFLEGGSEKAAAAGHVPVVTANDAPAVLGGDPEAKPKDWDPDAMIPFGPKPVPEDRWFESKPLWARVWVLSAGVIMNVLLTYVVCFALVAAFGESYFPTRVIGDVRPTPQTPALAAWLQPGDTVTSVAGRPVGSWRDIERRIEAATGDSVDIATNRGAGRFAIGAPGSAARSALLGALLPYNRPVVDDVRAGTPAQRAGLQVGDSVVAVNGTPVASFYHAVRILRASDGSEVRLEVRRDGRPLTLSMRAETVTETDPATGERRQARQIGVGVPIPEIERQRVPVHRAFAPALAITGRMGGEVITTVRGLFSGRVSLKQLGGPIAIARTSVSAARGGIETLFGLIALLSINVAILNLLPIPVLDGGQILLNLAEAVKGSAFSARTRENVLRVGLAAIALLFVTVMWNDITRLLADWIN